MGNQLHLWLDLLLLRQWSNSPSSGLAEISDVNVNNQGMTYNEPVLLDDSGSPFN